MMYRWFTTVMLAVVLFMGHAAKADISGLDDAAFQAALADWLGGNDTKALAAFASLARADNRAAQIFLGVIEKKTWTHNHVTADLPRKERIALLRNPQGLSGKSWLSSAAEDTPLAQMFLDVRNPYKDSQVALTLMNEGELLAPLEMITRAYDQRDILGALQIGMAKPAVPYSSGFVQPLFDLLPEFASVDFVDLNDPRFSSIQLGMEQFPSNDVAGSIMWGMNRNIPESPELFANPNWIREVGKQIAGHPLMPPVLDIVSKHCPDDTESALTTLQWASFRIPLFLSTLSPVETLLNTETYRSSARFEGDFLRHAGFTDPDLHFISSRNQCAANMIEQAIQ